MLFRRVRPETAPLNRRFARSMSLLMKDNLRSPLLVLLQPRAREQFKVETAHNGRPKVSALEMKSVECNTILRTDSASKGKGKGKGLRPSTSKKEFYGFWSRKGRDPLGKKENECPKGNACDYWHPPEGSHHQKRML